MLIWTFKTAISGDKEYIVRASSYHHALKLLGQLLEKDYSEIRFANSFPNTIYLLSIDKESSKSKRLPRHKKSAWIGHREEWIASKLVGS